MSWQGFSKQPTRRKLVARVERAYERVLWEEANLPNYDVQEFDHEQRDTFRLRLALRLLAAHDATQEPVRWWHRLRVGRRRR
jgi:hypothetical protein